MPTIRKNSRQLPDLKARLTDCTRYAQDNYYHGKPCDPSHAWTALGRQRATLTAAGDGGYTVHVHDNLWYELREPDATSAADARHFAISAGLQPPGAAATAAPYREPAAAEEPGAGDVTFTFPGGTTVTVDPDGTVLNGPDDPAPPEPTDASIRAVVVAAALTGTAGFVPPEGSMSRALIAEALKRGWLRGRQDTLAELAEIPPRIGGN